MHTPHQPHLLQRARDARKLDPGFVAPPVWADNTPEQLRAALAPLRRDGSLPDYPLGSDFDAVEQRLLKALAWLQSRTTTRAGKLRTIASALRNGHSGDTQALRRMALDAPSGLRERLLARLLALGLSATAADRPQAPAP